MIVIVGLAIFVAILLVLVVLSQSSKGGISANFIGSGASQMMGVKRTSDLLEKLTWGFAITLVILTLISNFFVIRPIDDTEIESINVERANQSIIPPAGSPAGGSTDGGLLPEDEAGDLSPESTPEEE